MSKKLYVGNLSYAVTDAELQEMFAEVGNVEEAVVIVDRMSGRSKGFGFVTMADDGEAEQAIEKFNGVEAGGRTLTVNEARPRTDREPRRF